MWPLVMADGDGGRLFGHTYAWLGGGLDAPEVPTCEVVYG